MSQSFCQAGLYYSMTQPVRPNADAQNRGNASRCFVLAVIHCVPAFHMSDSSAPFLDNFCQLMTLKFKLKGTHRFGVTLTEALNNVRISDDKTYSPRALNANSRGNLCMRILWDGYPSLTYEVPIDGYDGRISLQTLMRRVAHGCFHFVQHRGISIHPDRIILRSIEEVTSGTWQPALSVG